MEEDLLKPAQAELFSLSAATAKQVDSPQVRSGQKEGEERDIGGRQKQWNRNRHLGRDIEKKRSEKREHYKREKAASVIQTHWRGHRNGVSDTTQLRKRRY